MIWPRLGFVYLAMGHHGPLILAKFLRFRLGRAKPFKNHGMLLFQMEYLYRLVHSINISPTFGPVLLIYYIIRLIRCYCYILSDYQNSHVLWGFYLIKTSQNVCLTECNNSTWSAYISLQTVNTLKAILVPKWNKNKNTTGFYPIYRIPSLLILESVLCAT